MFKKTRAYGLVVSLFLISIGGVLAGMFLTPPLWALAKDRYQDLQLFAKVLNLVEQHYVDEVDTRKLVYGGIKGMLASLDPHTNFLPPDIFSEFKEETSGEFGGVGIEIGMQDDILTVVSPIEDSPAWKAGVKAGDRVVEIENRTTKGMSLAEAVSKMRGKKGTPATITIWREGFDKPRKVTIVRDLIKVKSVKFTDLEDGYVYARITSFIERTGNDLHDFLDKIEKKNGSLKGVILDLRNNPGGLLDQAVQVADEFMDDGPIVSTIGRNRNEKVIEYAKKEGTRAGFPVIVLVNEYSASASEIVAGALQDSKRALIMGQRTFGKGSVQSVVDLGEGAGLKMTVARYYTPAGKSIQGHGIDPDILLDNVDPDAYRKAIVQRKVMRESDIDGHLIGENEKSDDKNKAEEESDKSDVPFYKMPSFKKKQIPIDETPEERENREKAEDSKLTPKEKLLKRDIQAMQAFNYLKSWVVFKRFGVTGGSEGGASVPATAPAAPLVSPTPALKKEEASKVKPLPKKLPAKPAPTKPVPTASPKATELPKKGG